MNNAIEHGTSGLHWKWGQGKSESSSGSSSSQTKKPMTVARLTETKAALDAASTVAGNAKGSHNKKAEGAAKKAAKKEAKFMTDEELRARVNRMSLEESYSRLSSAERASGRDSVASFLSATTTALNVASSALSVALVIKQLSAKAT